MSNENKKKLGELLLEENLITREQLDYALNEHKQSGLKLGEFLIEKNIVTEEQIIDILKNQLNIQYIDLGKTNIDKEVLQLIPEEIIKKKKIIPFDCVNGEIYIAMQDPLDYFTIDDIKRLVGLKVNACITSQKQIETTIQKYYGKSVAERAAGEYLKQNIKENIEEEISFEENSPVVKFVNTIIENAIAKKASDIHIEPEEDEIRIRYRIDGNLKEEMKEPKDMMNSISSIIKIMCKMDITEKRIPQGGRTFYKLKDKTVDLRISILPVTNGEKIVIRILDKTNFILEKQFLGLNNKEIEVYENLLSKPYGILLITGPTGSGKTTTLYTMLNELNKEEKNIITIEDPVEYNFKGINQVQVNTKLGVNFANGLREILRQDPDIIMVGEIRDTETAKIAIRAALTGHLVLSTLHTNDSISSISRLIDMEIEQFLVSATVNGIIAQRLVRVICPKCKKEYIASQREKKLLNLNSNDDCHLYRGEGCDFCNNTGYKGRTAIFEILEMDKDYKEAIESSSSYSKLNEISKSKGLKTLKDSCIQKVLNGETTIEELLKVTFL